jgi:hypothetical protein
MLDIKQRKRENTMMELRKLLSSSNTGDSSSDWRGIIGAVFTILFLWLLGPLPLCCVVLQRLAAQDSWKAADRWGSIRLLSWLPLLYLPIFVFRQPLSLFWQAHLPGSLDIWPPTLNGWLLRSVLALPLIPACTLLLERVQPRTIPIRNMRRLPRPGEILKRDEEEAGTGTPPAPDQQDQNPPSATQKASSAKTGTKTTTRMAAREKKERDPRPIGETLAEERERRDQEKRKTTQQPTPQAAPSNLQVQSNVDSTEEQEYEGPDPFKKPINWRNVRE